MKRSSFSRSLASAVGALALVASSMASAAPSAGSAISPLVALSALGSTESRTAVCGAGACALPASTAIAAQGVSYAAPPEDEATPVYASGYGRDYGARRAFAVLLGLGLLAAIIAIQFQDSDDDDGGSLSPA